MENVENMPVRVNNKFQLLSDLTIALNTSNSLEEKLQLITDKVRELTACHLSVSSYVLDQCAEKIITKVSISDAFSARHNFLGEWADVDTHTLISHLDKPLRLTQAELELHAVWSVLMNNPALHGLLASPLLDKGGNKVGVILLSRQYGGAFSQEDEIMVAQLCQIAAIAIENAQLLHRLEEALKEKESAIKLNKTITDNATSALFMMNEKGFCTFMNPAGEKMFGYSFDEIRQKELHYLIHHHHPDGRAYPMDTCPIDRALPDNFDIRAHEDVFIRKDGTYVQVTCAASPIFDNGVPVSTVIEVRDITEEKKADLEIIERMERIRFILDAMPQKVWTASPAGNADYFNRNWLKYTGLSLEESLERGWKKAIHPDDVSITQKAWYNSVSSGDVFQVEQRFLRHDGAYRWHLSRALAYKDITGQIMMWIGTTTDIHDHKTALEHLARSNRDLTKINNDLDNFVYTASHDLKAPVLNIEGLMFALQRVLSPESKEKEDTRTILDLINQSIKRFKGTIEDLTEISKIQKNLGEDVEALSISSIISDVLLSISGLITASEATISVDTTAGNTIYFSKKDLHSVLFNLIDNAIKFCSPERKPIIAITTRWHGERMALSVKDNGLGIREDQTDKIFMMFRRMHNHVEGSGVGLYIVKKIVDNSEGEIKVESKVGEGSNFTVYIKNVKA